MKCLLSSPYRSKSTEGILAIMETLGAPAGWWLRSSASLPTFTRSQERLAPTARAMIQHSHDLVSILVCTGLVSRSQALEELLNQQITGSSTPRPATRQQGLTKSIS